MRTTLAIDDDVSVDETVCLHVMRASSSAHRLYRQMGFRDPMESLIRWVAPAC